MYFCLRNKVRRFHCEPWHKPPCSVCSILSWTTQYTQHRICLSGWRRGMKQWFHPVPVVSYPPQPCIYLTQDLPLTRKHTIVIQNGRETN
jgi:hypothetical protein